MFLAVGHVLMLEFLMAGSSKTTPILIVGVALVLIAAGAFMLFKPAEKPPRDGEETTASAGRVPLARLDAAIDRGVKAFIRDYVRPPYEHVSNGGYVEYTDALGETTRHGPDVYVACEIYLLTHFVMYHEELGIPADDPLLIKVHDWLLDEFDREKGRWIWSEEGCLHAKGMIALGVHGHNDLIDRAWVWARQSPLWRDDYKMFTMMQSGHIIQTLGNARLSLSGEHDWEHGSPIADAENSSKFLFAMLLAGHTLDAPEINELYRGIDFYFENNPLIFAEMHTRDVVGMVWFVFCHHRFGLPQGPGYRFCVDTMTAGVGSGGQLRKHGLTEHFVAVRGLVIKALMLAGVKSPAIEDQVRYILDKQDPSGAWKLTPQAKKNWGLGITPINGMKMGQMDGANTYLTVLTLISYREKYYGKGGGGLIPMNAE